MSCVCLAVGMVNPAPATSEAAEGPRVYSVKWERPEQPPLECWAFEAAAHMATFVAPDQWAVRQLPGEEGLALVPTNLVAAISLRWIPGPPADETRASETERIHREILDRHPGARILGEAPQRAGSLVGRGFDFVVEVQPEVRAAFRLAVFPVDAVRFEVELRAPADRVAEYYPVLARFLATLWAGGPAGPWSGFPRAPAEPRGRPGLP